MATFRGQYRFTVKESSNGSPWVAAEPAGETIRDLGNLGFDLEAGTTMEDARALANLMNARISAVSVTRK
jgi:hypothetical protein